MPEKRCQRVKVTMFDLLHSSMGRALPEKQRQDVKGMMFRFPSKFNWQSIN